MHVPHHFRVQDDLLLKSDFFEFLKILKVQRLHMTGEKEAFESSPQDSVFLSNKSY